MSLLQAIIKRRGKGEDGKRNSLKECVEYDGAHRIQSHGPSFMMFASICGKANEKYAHKGHAENRKGMEGKGRNQSYSYIK